MLAKCIYALCQPASATVFFPLSSFFRFRVGSESKNEEIFRFQVWGGGVPKPENYFLGVIFFWSKKRSKKFRPPSAAEKVIFPISTSQKKWFPLYQLPKKKVISPISTSEKAKSKKIYKKTNIKKNTNIQVKREPRNNNYRGFFFFVWDVKGRNKSTFELALKYTPHR